MKYENHIKQLLTCEVGGRTWKLYPIDFESPDGKFSVYVHAVSREHAMLQLDAIKETGRIGDDIVGVVDA